MKILCWNMAGAFSSKERHTRAWAWLNDQDADVALLQEAVPYEDAIAGWGSVAFRKNGPQYGTAVLVKAGGYELWDPIDEEPWLQRVRGVVCVAKPADEQGLWLVSVHSSASSFEETIKKYPNWYADLPSREGIPRCSEVQMWEIEPSAWELRGVLMGSRFVLGGDLNSSRLFDENGRDENERLFSNLHAQGYVDSRLRHSASEMRTWFKAGQRPLQLDHVFTDIDTEANVTSWRVHAEPAEALGLSDHAPIEVQLAGADTAMRV